MQCLVWWGICVHQHAQVFVHVCAYLWRPEVNLGSHFSGPTHLLTLFFGDRVSPWDMGVLGWALWPLSPRELPVCLSGTAVTGRNCHT